MLLRQSHWLAKILHSLQLYAFFTFIKIFHHTIILLPVIIFRFQYLWIPDVIIHDLVKFSKPEILNEVAALEIFKNKMVYYKIRWANKHFQNLYCNTTLFLHALSIFHRIKLWPIVNLVRDYKWSNLNFSLNWKFET